VEEDGVVEAGVDGAEDGVGGSSGAH